MNQTCDRYCAFCRGWHQVEVETIDADGFPDRVRELVECPAALLDGLGRTAGRAMAILVDAGHWDEVEETAAIALEINDPPEPESVA